MSILPPETSPTAKPAPDAQPTVEQAEQSPAVQLPPVGGRIRYVIDGFQMTQQWAYLLCCVQTSLSTKPLRVKASISFVRTNLPMPDTRTWFQRFRGVARPQGPEVTAAVNGDLLVEVWDTGWREVKKATFSAGGSHCEADVAVAMRQLAQEQLELAVAVLGWTTMRIRLEKEPWT